MRKAGAIFAAVVLAAMPQQKPEMLADPSVDWAGLGFPAARGRHSTVFRGEKGKSGFNLHSYLAFHDGRFWAVWSSAALDEEDPDQHVAFATSANGHHWEAPRVLAPDPDGPAGPKRWIARGISLRDGKLTALGALVESADYGKRGKDVVWKNLNLVEFEWKDGRWNNRGVFAADCMNNFPPVPLGDRLAMVCRDSKMDVFTALQDPSSPSGWKRVPLASSPPFHRMDEPTWYQDRGGVVHMIVRDNNRSRRLIRSISRDAGATWSRPVLTNYPDATSKNFTGRLSNGWYFLINNPNPAGRDPLVVSFSRDGWTFSHPLTIRRGGQESSASFQYPHAIEQAGSLWVAYSINKKDIEISELPIAGLGLE